MNIILDLDGTLICPKWRIYGVFQALVPYSNLTFDQYWCLKYAGLSNPEILRNYFNFSEESVKEFITKWMLLIESSDFLALDHVMSGVFDVLEKLTDFATLYLCTARQDSGKVEAQLAKLGLMRYFSDVMVTGPDLDKAEVLASEGLILKSSDWLVGDTGRDVQTSLAIGVRSCAVATGVMNRYNLMKYSPTFLCESLSEFHQNVLKS